MNKRGVYLIKVCYDLVEKSEALQSFLIDIRLCIKLFEVWDGGEHHAHSLVRLMIKVLITDGKKIRLDVLYRTSSGDREMKRDGLWFQ